MTATPPRIVGADLSLTATGLAHSGDGTTETIRTGKLRGTERLHHIRGRVLDASTGADLILIEGPSYGSQGPGHHESAGLWWLITWTLDQHNIPYAILPPATVKKFATGRGNATKPDMRVALLQRVGLDLRDDNQVDAFWLRAAGLEYSGHPIVDLPKAQIEALGKATWPELAVASC